MHQEEIAVVQHAHVANIQALVLVHVLLVGLDIINQIAVQRAALLLPPQVIIQQVAHARNQLAELEKIQI